MAMLQTPCPYCGHPEMPDAPKDARPFAQCPACGKKSRAKIVTLPGVRLVRYVATSRRTPDPKRVRSVRMSDAEMRAVEAGRLRLTVSNGRITLAV